MSSPRGSSASIWIDNNVALFVVLVVAAVLLLVTIVTLVIYCCCCRKKTDHWKRERTESKSTNSHVIHVDLHGDSLDADSAVTANVRVPGTFEIHIETEQREKSQYAAPQDSYPQPVARVEEVQIQHDALPETTLPKSAKIDKQVQRDQMVIHQVSLQAQQQQQEHQKQQQSVIETRKHQRQGLNIYESGINEITIVDSDFSDYEESKRDEEKTNQNVLNSVSKIGWQLLPNHSVQPVTSGANEEPEVFAIDRHGQRYVPEPSPTIKQKRIQQANNLAELDQILDIFKQQAAEATVSAPAVQVEVKLDGDVDEELVQPIDRSQVA